MSKTCPKAPASKREYLTDIGKILVNEYGKKRYYKPEEVKNAHKKSKRYDGSGFSCWAMSIYSHPSDFNDHHKKTGEKCDYVAMRTEMLQGLSSGSKTIDLPDFDIDSSWLDLGTVFGKILGGIANLVSEIFDGD